ncbi:MAG: TIGR02391 family protein [Rhodospirillales bacterium]|nr:TIGR02391 family protein [Rhodospirillales bacterium]
MTTPEGIYQIAFAGNADSGTGVIVLADGRVRGEDAAGVQYDGSYEYHSVTDSTAARIRMTVPPGVELVQGVPKQAAEYSFEVNVTLPSNFSSGQRISITTEFGPVNVVFKPLNFELHGIFQAAGLYLFINDETLRSRCSDLLKADNHFDRVINQATQILEERIRQRTCLQGQSTELVNRVIKADIDKTILKFSDDPAEQEGLSFIYKGVMLALRNPTHHRLSDSVTRDRALKICGFIDALLEMIDTAELKQQ